MNNKMSFEYFGGAQRTPEWFEIRRGKVSASRLAEWLATSKRDGSPLKARLDYEKELSFEMQFNRNYNVWVSAAMQNGIDYEDFARRQYNKVTGANAQECGCWYNDYFVASPDATVGEDGLVEIKVLTDSSFTEVLSTGVPEKHWQQIQGQLFASGRKWCDYVAMSLTTKKLKIIRVTPHEVFHNILEESLMEPIPTLLLDHEGLYDIVDELPESFTAPAMLLDRSDSNLNGGLGW